MSRRPRRIALAAAVGLTLCLSALAVVAIWLDRAYPPDLSRLLATGTEVLDRNGRTIALLPAPGGVWRFRVSAEQVSPALIDRLVATEDRRFWWHPGVDPIALLRAVGQMLRAGHVVSGGSTLTMQVARLLEPRPRTLRSKLIEVGRALQLEARFSKAEILGMWLSLAPYGGNLEGVRAGAQAWFGVSPAYLDDAQSALLVAIPRRPEALRPDRHAAAAERLRDRIFREAAGEPVPDHRHVLPRHAAQVLPALGRGPRIETTLDLPLQSALERFAGEQLMKLPERASIAIVVADAASRDILAIIPGAWRDEHRAGMIDLTRAIRSPGSTLKPFLYALAFQQGLARPDSILTDLPQHFGAYGPENFDHSHSGRVTAAEALRRSLNLPAVVLLDRLGPLRFAASLKSAYLPLRLPVGADPSLPLALGGAGTTLRDLVGLYAGLATNGVAFPVHLLASRAEPKPFVQPQTARLVAEILTQDFPAGGPPGVAWKTGTSWGGRDAWAFGFDRQHVVGVWVGRPDGTPLAGATGRSLALPMLARVIDMLPAAPRDPPPRIAQTATPPATHADTLRLIFPPPFATVSGDGPIVLRAMGGQRPLTFMIDGAPIGGAPALRQARWVPTGPGFYAVTVLDAAGEVAHAQVRVR